MAAKKRLDLVLEERGLCASRQLARTAIMDGAVLVNGEKVTKPGTQVREDVSIELTGAWRETKKFVSRGGLKLEKALDTFLIDVRARHCLDVGASTGGFTDCLLKRGASTVYAIDVGYGQLDWSLRSDDRVVVRERINARTLVPGDLYDEGSDTFATLAVMDLAFISVTKVLPAVILCLADNAEIVALIKPQFEAGPKLVGKGGVVRLAETHESVLLEVLHTTAAIGLHLAGLTFSPVKGPAGNIEFLAHWFRGSAPLHGEIAVIADAISEVVADAHRHLDQP
ncbi:MAG: TlyA family RNA methyltransferase [Candidatus Obscuribacterales bacterium]|nr:TlyA family RNA methyltransferase [Candidatus Obscuribacterales bacterium]